METTTPPELPMRPEIKQRWLEELRSGNYQQGKESLRTTASSTGGFDRYCCLGVLCEIAVNDGVIEPPVEASHPDAIFYAGVTTFQYGNEREASYLPAEVVRWAGLDSNSPTVTYNSTDGLVGELDLNGSTRSALAELNDAGMDFARIADVIEEQL